MLVVDVEEVIIHLFEEKRIIEQDQVRHEERFESIVEVRNQFEIVYWHKCNQLHVLDQNPKRKETDILFKQEKELGDNYDDHDEVHSDCHVS